MPIYSIWSSIKQWIKANYQKIRRKCIWIIINISIKYKIPIKIILILISIIFIIFVSYKASLWVTEKGSNEPIILRTAIHVGEYVKGCGAKPIDVRIQTVSFYFNENWTKIIYFLIVNLSEKENIYDRNITLCFNKENHSVFDVKNLRVFVVNNEGDLDKELENNDFKTELFLKDQGEDGQWAYKSYPLKNLILNNNNFWLIVDFKEKSIFPKDDITLMSRRGELVVDVQVFGEFQNGDNAIIVLPQKAKIIYVNPNGSFEPKDPYTGGMKRLIFDITGKYFDVILTINHFDFYIFISLFAIFLSIISLSITISRELKKLLFS